MKTRWINFLPLLLIALCCISYTSAHKQMSRPITTIYDNKELYDTLAWLDSIVFDAFNKCKFDVFKSLFTEDLEFYHDKGGLTNYAQSVASLKSKCSQSWTVRRELVPGSLEVYPVPGYGAIQAGSHRFYNTEKGPETLGGTFKFVHIWQRKNGDWKISRVVSYDH